MKRANFSESRDLIGKFKAVNPGGPGNPFARRAAELRREFLEAVTLDDVRKLSHALVQRANARYVAASHFAVT